MKPAERDRTLERFTLPTGLVLLAVWIMGMVMMNPAPGWLHAFLVFGVFTVIWGIVVRGDRSAPAEPGD